MRAHEKCFIINFNGKLFRFIPVCFYKQMAVMGLTWKKVEAYADLCGERVGLNVVRASNRVCTIRFTARNTNILVRRKNNLFIITYVETDIAQYMIHASDANCVAREIIRPRCEHFLICLVNKYKFSQTIFIPIC